MATEKLSYIFPSATKDFYPAEKSAAAHNGIYRGKDLTSYFDSGDMSTSIANGSFNDIFIGDYITKTVTTAAATYTDKAGNSQTQAEATYSNVKWLVAACDPHLHYGDTETTAHHVLVIPANSLLHYVSMNPTNTTDGGYLGSDMWRIHMPIWSTAIKVAFGESHVLKHRELLTNAVNATAPSAAGANFVGTASNSTWVDVEVNIPNECMVCGQLFGSSGYDGGEFPRMLPLYALKPDPTDNRSWFWLRSVASESRFCSATGNGGVTSFGASFSHGGGGIRPYFLLK